MEIDVRKTKKVLNYLLSEGKIPFFVAKLIFSHSYALAANQSNKEELVKKAFFRYSLAFTKGLITKEPYGLNFVTILEFFVSR